jgi:hypothetical protein
MSPEPTGKSSDGGLQFDKVEPAGGAGGGALKCASCKKPIAGEYYHLGNAPLCSACKTRVEAQIAAAAARGKSGAAFTRAALFGIGAAVAGAIVYYAVIAITNFEIGIVAIAIGYMVGWGVRKGAGVPGRRFQVLSVTLTYLAVGLAYTPLAVQEILKKKENTVVVRHDSTTGTAVAEDSTKSSAGGGSVAMAVIVAIALIVLLPILSIVMSLPSGLISALIIFIGLRMAWRMTGGTLMQVTGPFKIGSAPASSTR